MNKILYLMALQAVMLPTHALHITSLFLRKPLPCTMIAQPLRLGASFTKRFYTNSQHGQSCKTYHGSGSKMGWLCAGLLSCHMYIKRDYYTEQIQYFPEKLLLEGICKGDIRLVNLACALGLDIRKAEKDGIPVLEYAILRVLDQGHDVALVQNLLDHGADITATTKSHAAYSASGSSLLHLLVSRDNFYDLHIAQLINIVVAAGLGSVINEQDVQEGQTPLMKAVITEQSVNVFKALLSAKPDVHIKDGHDFTVSDHIQVMKKMYEEEYKKVSELAIINSDIVYLDIDRQIAKWDEIQRLVDACKNN